MEANTGLLAIVRIFLRSLDFFFRSVTVTFVVNKVVHAFDTPFIQYLTFVGAEVIDELDRRNRILTGSRDTYAGTGRQTLIHQRCALCIRVHGQRKPCIGRTVLAVCL